MYIHAYICIYVYVHVYVSSYIRKAYTHVASFDGSGPERISAPRGEEGKGKGKGKVAPPPPPPKEAEEGARKEYLR